MMRLACAIGLACLAAAPALAQDAATKDITGALSEKSTGGTQTMAQLLAKGYEIKAAVPSGTDKLIIFMQNEESAYACEFVNLTTTRCGSIN